MKNSFSIIIPAYKEEKTIEKTLTGILKLFRENNVEFEIITVIDLVPNDRTVEIVSTLSNSFNEIKILSRKGKLGIASALRDGIKATSKNVILIAMGDASEDPKDLLKMSHKMNEGYDMVFANRFSDKPSIEKYPKKKYIVNRLCNFTIKVFFGIRSSDITNAVKAYKSEILKNLNITSSGFEVFIELPIKAFLNGYKNFAEISSSHFAGDPSQSKFNISSEGPRYLKVILKCLYQKNS